MMAFTHATHSSCRKVSTKRGDCFSVSFPKVCSKIPNPLPSRNSRIHSLLELARRLFRLVYVDRVGVRKALVSSFRSFKQAPSSSVPSSSLGTLTPMEITLCTAWLHLAYDARLLFPPTGPSGDSPSPAVVSGLSEDPSFEIPSVPRAQSLGTELEKRDTQEFQLDVFHCTNRLLSEVPQLFIPIKRLRFCIRIIFCDMSVNSCVPEIESYIHLFRVEVGCLC